MDIKKKAILDENNILRRIDDLSDFDKAKLEKAYQKQADFAKGRSSLVSGGVPTKSAVTNAPVETLYDMADMKKEFRAKELASKRASMLGKGKSIGKSVGKRVGNRLPILASLLGAYSAFQSGDAAAAVPILNEAEGLGPRKGSLEYKLESGERLSPEEYEQLRKMQEDSLK